MVEQGVFLLFTTLCISVVIPQERLLNLRIITHS